MEINGAVAIVTGAAGGIGSALAQRLLENGARVLATDLDPARLADRVADLSRYGENRIVGLAGDCSLEATVRDLVSYATSTVGSVDFFFANAGVGLAQEEATDDEWVAALEVNVLAHVRAARVLLPGWLERGRGYFVSTASAAGLLTQIGSPTYAVSKHAAVAFSEWLSVTYGDRGVRVSCVCPMGVNTAMLTASAEDHIQSRGQTRGRRHAQRVARAVTEAGAVLEPLEVADRVLEGVANERFLVLPHPEVAELYRRRADDPERWLAGMRRYQRTLD